MECVQTIGHLLLGLFLLGVVFFTGLLGGHIMGVTDVKAGTFFGLKKRQDR